ncbi:MAG: M23 family metallopeptidase [Candidatus Peregrinibacteria bacterium]|nr:M23 family metallopeptidase [Candidatus Peregrinibacteria bacterium]
MFRNCANSPLCAALLSLMLSACASSTFGLPLPNARERLTPLAFGLYVTPDPAQNPINPPERFTGFHAGLDFEIRPGEADREVTVYAICDGAVAYSGSAEGYGGVIVQHCALQGEPVTVLYGHLSSDSRPEVGQVLTRGETIGTLAPGHSVASGFNRKHLHLGIHRGETVEFLGYVQSERELENFIDPAGVIPLYGQ